MMLHLIHVTVVAWFAVLCTTAPVAERASTKSELSLRSIPFTGIPDPGFYHANTDKYDDLRIPITVLKRNGIENDQSKRDTSISSKNASCFCPGSQTAIYYGKDCQCVDEPFSGVKRDVALVAVAEAICFCPGTQFPRFDGGKCHCIDDHFPKREAPAAYDKLAFCRCHAGQILLSNNGVCHCGDLRGNEKRQIGTDFKVNESKVISCPDGGVFLCVRGECFCTGDGIGGGNTTSPVNLPNALPVVKKGVSFRSPCPPHQVLVCFSAACSCLGSDINNNTGNDAGKSPSSPIPLSIPFTGQASDPAKSILSSTATAHAKVIPTSTATASPLFASRKLVTDNRRQNLPLFPALDDCLVRVCPPRFTSVSVNGVCECQITVPFSPRSASIVAGSKFGLIEDCPSHCPPHTYPVWAEGSCYCRYFVTKKREEVNSRMVAGKGSVAENLGALIGSRDGS